MPEMSSGINGISIGARLYIRPIRVQEYERNSSFLPRRLEKRDDHSTTVNGPKSDKYLSSRTSDRSVVRERRRHCRGRTLTNGFRGCSAHKDATIFSWPLATFHSTARRVHARCSVRSRVRLMRSCPPSRHEA